MTIQYDKLQEAYASLRAFRQAFLDGVISAEELAAQKSKVKADIREILGFPPPPA